MSSWNDMDPFEHGCLAAAVVCVVLSLFWVAISLHRIADSADRPCPQPAAIGAELPASGEAGKQP